MRKNFYKCEKDINLAYISYYDLSYDTNDLGSLRYIYLLKNAKKRNITFTKYQSKNHQIYDAILLIDIPRIKDLIKLNWNIRFKSYKKIILVLEETPIARNRFLINIPFLFNSILVNTIELNLSNLFYPIFCFKHPNLPSKKYLVRRRDIILKGNRKKNICFIGKNNSTISKLSTYRTKYKIIYGLNKYRDIFSLYGHDWEKIVLPMDIPFKALLVRLPAIKSFIKLIFYFFKKLRGEKTIKSLGKVDSKLKVFENHDFSLAFEPYIGKPLMLLEKIFDPMKSGTIPIYYGNNNEIDIPKDTYISINSNTKSEDILEIIDNITEREKRGYRLRIYKYLLSKKADLYRYDYAANNFLDIILNVLSKK